jgi:hypothetical protein
LRDQSVGWDGEIAAYAHSIDISSMPEVVAATAAPRNARIAMLIEVSMLGYDLDLGQGVSV